MLEYIKNKKEIISTHLLSFLEAKSSDLSGINAWGEEIPRRIYSFSREGKMIRGALVLFANEMCSSENADDAMKAACAVEILQSYLLIHDDIMDRDRFRRGAPSVYYTFQLDAEKTSMENPAQYGESMGICAGDVAIFMALELLARCSPQALRGGKLVRTFHAR